MLFSSILLPPLAARRLKARFPHLLGTGLVLLLGQAELAHAQAPTITALSPARNAGSAPRTTNVTASFDQPLSNSPATQQALQVLSQTSGRRKAGTATVSGNTLTFDPTTDFLAGEKVIATVTSAIQSSSGQALTKPQTYQFTTATAPSSGTFRKGAELPAVSGATQTADVDADGDLDLLTLTGSAVQVSLNNGNATFSSGQLVSLAGSSGTPTQFAIGDLDGDADADFVVVNSGNFSTIAVLLNNGNGTFALGQVLGNTAGGLANNLNTIALADLNADGNLDIVTANSPTGRVGSVHLFLNAGNATFTRDAAIGSGVNNAFALGDIDNDGDVDIITSNFAFFTNSPVVQVFLNDGAGVFSFGQQITGASGVRLLDFDGDGDLDLQTSYEGKNVLLNEGGTFDKTAGSTIAIVAAGDLDGDGDQDLLSPQSGNDSLQVLLNNSQGQYSQSPTAGNLPRHSALADLDKDGDLDIYTFDGPVSVWLNQPLPASLVVTTLSPPRNAVTAPRPTNVAVMFDQPLSNNAATQQALRVFSQQAGGKKVSTATVSGNMLTVDPSSDFKAGETVYATLTTAAQSSTGASLAKPQVFQFTVATAPALATFTAAPDLPNTTKRTIGAVGDVDGDGDLDLLAYSYAAVQTLLNDGKGNFTDSSITALPQSTPSSLKLGDMDGDGDLDFVVTTSYVLGGISGGVSIGYNNGHGSFSLNAGAGIEPAFKKPSPRTHVPADIKIGGDTYTNMVLGDLDGDSDLDYVTVSKFVLPDNPQALPYIVRVVRRNGSSSSTQTLDLPNGSNQLALGDIDDDGDLDLLTTTGGTITFFANDGTGKFGSGTDISGNGRLALGDIDSDGDLDIVNSYGTVLLNNGAGTFTYGSPTNMRDADIELADVDGDGDLDALAPNLDTNQVHVRLNNGLGIFSNSPDVVVGNTPTRILVGDLNSNGTLDFITDNGLTNPASVRLNQAIRVDPLLVTAVSPTRNALAAARNTTVAVTFNQALSTGTAMQGALKVFSQQGGGKKAGTATVSGNTLSFDPSADFKPGEMVFVTVTAAAQSNVGASAVPHVFQFTTATRRSNAQFSTGPDVPLNNPYSLVTGDVDGDGDLDLLSATQGSPGTSNLVSVRLNTGTGSFTNGQEVAVSSYGKILLGDLDADGDLDLITSHGVHLNGGNGVFGSGQQLGIGGSALGDLDGNGSLDLLADSLIYNPNTNAPSSIVQVRLNTGGGKFSKNQQVPISGLGSISIALSDLNNDGVLDLVAGGSSNGLVTVHLGNGAGGFLAARPDISVSTMPNGLNLGDADGDGDLDLFATNSGSTVTVLLNDGQGNFGSPRFVNLGSYSVFAGVGDVDGDGDLDLLAGGFPNSISMRLNDGQGNFSGSQSITVNDSPRAIALGDLDGDGTLDFATANTGGSASIRLNTQVLATAPAHLAEQVSLYPNPAHDAVQLRLPAELARQSVQVRLTTTLGQVVLEQNLPAQAAAKVRLPKLAAGVYTMRLATDQGLITKRLLIE